MTFWIIAGVMTAVGVAVLVFVLLRKRTDIKSNQTEQNIVLAREKLAELEREKAAGNLDEATYQEAKEELETSLLEDTRIEDKVAKVRPASAYLGAFLVALLVPLLSVGIYLQIGSPQYTDAQAVAAMRADNPHAPNNGGGAPTMQELLVQLEARMQETPDDPEGWFMLGRVYQSLQRYADAAKAYEKLAALTDNHPQALIPWADSLAMAQGGRLLGKPYELVRMALDKAPENNTALWLAGQGAMESGDYQNAVYYWRRAEAGLAENPEYVQELRALIAQAKARAAQSGLTIEDPGSAVDLQAAQQAPTTSSARIRLHVRLAPELQSRVEPNDRLFIFAKQVSGRPMPVAALRLKAGDLPLDVVLDDGSMLQGDHLADFAQLKVMARISKHGEPMAASGDLQSRDVIVDVGQQAPIELTIEQVVP